MPDIQGTNVLAPIRPTHTDAVIPTAHADEILGGLKFAETEADLSSSSAFIPERRPRGTVASVGIGRFKQWDGSTWLDILQGVSTPTVGSSMTEVWLDFGGTQVSLPPASGTSAGSVSTAILNRINKHADRHKMTGSDPLITTTPTAGMAPMGDTNSRIPTGWLYPATRTVPGTVYVANDGESPVDGPAGDPIAVVRANDSRLRQITDILDRINDLEMPIQFVQSLPPAASANPQAFYWLIPDESMYIVYQNTWMMIAGKNMVGQPGKSAYEIAQDQGFTGFIDEWLDGLKGADGSDGDDGLSAYELAVLGGFQGDITDWLSSIKGEKGDPGDQGLSAYEVALAEGYMGSREQWLLSLQGEKGDSAYKVAVDNGFIGTQQEWLESIKGEKGDTGDGIDLLGYYVTKELFDDAGLTGNKGDYYCVGGDLYGWSVADQDWKYLGPLFEADTFSFEYEVWLNQPDNSDKTFEDFLREILVNAVDSVDIQQAIEAEVTEWITEDSAAVLQPMVDQWLSQNFSEDIDQAVTDWMNANASDMIQDKVDEAIANGLSDQIDQAIRSEMLTHVTDYHTWNNMGN